MLPKVSHTSIRQTSRTRFLAPAAYASTVHHHTSRSSAEVPHSRPFSLRIQSSRQSHILVNCFSQPQHDKFRSYATQAGTVSPSSDPPFLVYNSEKETLATAYRTTSQEREGIYSPLKIGDDISTRALLRKWHEKHTNHHLLAHDEGHSNEDLLGSWNPANPSFHISLGDGITANEGSSDEVGEDLDEYTGLESIPNLELDPESQFTWRSQIIPRQGDLLFYSRFVLLTTHICILRLSVVVACVRTSIL